MRRILHIIDSLGPTGAARQMLTLAGGMARQGFDVHVCALNESGDMTLKQFEEELGQCSTRAEPISFACVGRRWSIDPLADWKLRRLVARLRPDVVHTWNSVAGMFG